MKRKIIICVMLLLMISISVLAEDYELKQGDYELTVRDKVSIGGKLLYGRGEHLHNKKLKSSMLDIYYIGYDGNNIKLLACIDQLKGRGAIAAFGSSSPDPTTGFVFEMVIPYQESFDLVLTQLGGWDLKQIPKVTINIKEIDDNLNLILDEPTNLIIKEEE